jgi:hypothetical protein
VPCHKLLVTAFLHLHSRYSSKGLYSTRVTCRQPPAATCDVVAAPEGSWFQLSASVNCCTCQATHLCFDQFSCVYIIWYCTVVGQLHARQRVMLRAGVKVP